ncbi:hypothetical protein X943_000633 [Babesia divergens]|uniref:Uncharacterized protein n=1 Tax=Babesia divergens TaxID=32595 RepID=A0AAD9G5B9_BABDI|nr:hypothetical protein X943_000633 [Babesia divergens]
MGGPRAPRALTAKKTKKIGGGPGGVLMGSGMGTIKVLNGFLKGGAIGGSRLPGGIRRKIILEHIGILKPNKKSIEVKQGFGRTL